MTACQTLLNPVWIRSLIPTQATVRQRESVTTGVGIRTPPAGGQISLPPLLIVGQTVNRLKRSAVPMKLLQIVDEKLNMIDKKKRGKFVLSKKNYNCSP